MFSSWSYHDIRYENTFSSYSVCIHLHCSSIQLRGTEFVDSNSSTMEVFNSSSRVLIGGNKFKRFEIAKLPREKKRSAVFSALTTATELWGLLRESKNANLRCTFRMRQEARQVKKTTKKNSIYTWLRENLYDKRVAADLPADATGAIRMQKRNIMWDHNLTICNLTSWIFFSSSHRSCQRPRTSEAVAANLLVLCTSTPPIGFNRMRIWHSSSLPSRVQLDLC